MPTQPADTSFGIDVSRWQDTIDWDRVKPNISFAYGKASGGDEGLYVDGQFSRNAAELTRLNIPWGPYHFAGGVQSPEVEAAYFARAIQWQHYTLPPVLDWEPRSYNSDAALNWVIRFSDHFRSLTGVKPVIYTGAYVNLTRSSALLEFDLWLAAYTDTPTDCRPWGRDGWSIWQYSSTGRVPGIQGNVDCNYAKNSWLNKYLNPPAPTTPEEIDDVPLVTCVLHTDTDKRYLWDGATRPVPASDVQIQTAAALRNGGAPLPVVEVNEAFVSELLG